MKLKSYLTSLGAESFGHLWHGLTLRDLPAILRGKMQDLDVTEILETSLSCHLPVCRALRGEGLWSAALLPQTSLTSSYIYDFFLIWGAVGRKQSSTSPSDKFRIKNLTRKKIPIYLEAKLSPVETNSALRT